MFQLIEIISRCFFFLSPYSFQLDLIFWLLSEYTFRLHTFSGYPYLRLLLVVDRLVVFESWYSMYYLLRLLVWKLEIKVLLYLPVSQPPTVTMVLVSIKKEIPVLSVCAVSLCITRLYCTHNALCSCTM